MQCVLIKNDEMLFAMQKTKFASLRIKEISSLFFASKEGNLPEYFNVVVISYVGQTLQRSH